MINEAIILKMAEPSIKNGILTYDLFDRIYGMLSRKEQYQVCEILFDHHIQLGDTIYPSTDDIFVENSSDNALVDEKKDSFFDEGIFKDAKSSDEYVFYSGKVNQSNDTLVKLIQEGNKQARQDICIKNEGLVRKYAKAYYRYFGNDLEFEDLMQAGFLGLLIATERFKFEKDSAFSTYAVFWIKQAISRQIYDVGYRVRIPVYMMERIARMTHLDNQYGADCMDYKRRIQCIAKDMEITEDDVEKLMALKHQFLSSVSLDTPVGEEEESTLGDFIPVDEENDVEDTAIRNALASFLDTLLATLTPREEKILRMRFGFYDGNPKTLEEVGKEFGVTRERIRQIEEKAIHKLRHPSKLNKIKAFIDD